MDRIRIRGGNRLNGSIPISGAKNAALPLMIVSLLTPGALTLSNVPRLADVRLLQRILQNHGIDITVAGKRAGQTGMGDVMHLSAKDIADTTAPYELVSRMRASFWVLGPLLARCGEAKVSLPGGCAIGTRPVDMHLMAMERLGAQITIENGYVIATAKQGLKGAHIVFDKVSVGATHAALMAAVLAQGDTIIENAASEPEIGDVAECLVKMGAKIEGIHTSALRIRGVTSLSGAEHSVIPDRIETGTYAMCAGMTGGDVLLKDANANHLGAVIDVMQRAGVTVDIKNDGLRIYRNGAALEPVRVDTEPFPGFPTDCQAQLMAMMTMANGTSMIRETIFENRFMHVQELARLGSDIHLYGDTAEVRGVKKLTGAPVMATDLRASVSLVIAGLAAAGETMISRVYHLDRGFETLEDKLSACGADVARISG
ncbi:MAG: UDP-N-acetylglucosamine 1-carboxyvinyltransferase [Aestuariivirga sp.]|uniref:UDP-N-acetylglucosamine 1-carboxyvinyltransferase n=1 Tax=Aestuariivirga sp. TaxID=2650926 RepID=UPI0025C05E91|nr:UDP-N-acetylglucosamine 1-carboxyvinyltransferase [Aestuariivirga sp.]MCA3559623.1 UDP-N-acetylglucosamine 1-carboxyvinyltransferase [Aestuariivirga sp.]